ncbi:MAG: hypothetical protein ACYDG4_13265 [Desulfuromonadaceae bacterium]
MANLEALIEAERRGILPEGKKSLLAEARARGLVPGTDPRAVEVGAGGSFSPMSLDDINRVMTERDPKERSLNLLPAIGATAATAAGPPGLLASILMATAGGAGGRLVENLIRKNTGLPGGPQTPTERFTDPLVEGAKMGAFEAVGGPVSAMLRPGAAKLAGDPAAQNLLKFSEEQGLPFSPSTIVPSKTASFVEGVTNFFPTGKGVTTLYQNKLSKWLLDSRSQVISDLTGISTGGTGKRLIAETGAVKEGLAKGSKENYATIESEIAKVGQENSFIPMENTAQLLRGLYENGTAKNSKQLQSLIAEFEKSLVSANPNMKPTMMKPEDFNQWQATINKKANQAGEYGLADKIWGIVNTDVKAFDTAQGTQLLDAISTAKLDYKVMMRYKKLTDYFNLASTTGPQGQEIFQTGKFYNIIMNDKNKKTLIKDIGQEAYENLVSYAETALKISQETGKRALSPIGQIFQTGMTGGGMYAAATNPTLLVPYAAAPVAAWQIMKPKGIFKKWLTTGLNPEKTGKVLKVGGRAAIASMNEE